MRHIRNVHSYLQKKTTESVTLNFIERAPKRGRSQIQPITSRYTASIKNSCARHNQYGCTSKFPFSSGRACKASSMSLQPGGSMLSTGKYRRSSLPTEFSGVMVQSSGGRQAKTFPEKLSWGISCSRRITYSKVKERRKPRQEKPWLTAHRENNRSPS